MTRLSNLALISICFGIGAFFLSCSPKADQSILNQPLDTMSVRPVVYQMFTRLFGNTNTNNQPWGTIEENGVGKFADITPKALNSIRKMGITHVWYTGVIEHGVLTDYTQYGIPLDDADVVKGRAGSPYAIKDYYDVNPDLATEVPNRMAEFEALIERTHKEGMKVIMDCVPNHVARNYKSDVKPNGVKDFGESDDTKKTFSPQNNFYYMPGQPFQVPAGYESLGPHAFPTKDGKFDENPSKATGNDVFSANPAIWDWFETVKLNYGVDYQNNRTKYFDPIPSTWLKMRDILLFWAEKGVDGFRCDMAEMVPVEFWNWVTAEVKKQYPDIIFIAEIYNPNAYRDYIFTGGFDYLYDKVEMYDTLKHIIQHKASTDDITTIWQRQDGIGANMLRFLENHDEQRIASPDFTGDMRKGIPMMAVSSFMHNGPVMLYFGQDVGEPGKGASGFSGDDGRTTIFDYWGVPEHVKWVNDGKFDGGQLSLEQKQLQEAYRKILKACNAEPAFREGAFYDLHYYNRNSEYTGYSNQIYAFVRHTKGQVMLVIVNFGSTAEECRIKIPEAAWTTFGIEGDEVKISGDAKLAIQKSSTFDYTQKTELVVSAPPINYQLITLETN